MDLLFDFGEHYLIEFVTVDTKFLFGVEVVSIVFTMVFGVFYELAWTRANCSSQINRLKRNQTSEKSGLPN